MNNQPIGIFDSGIGGLTVMAEIIRALPNENIIYFGDTAHVPYGSKSKSVVTDFSLNIAAFLRKKNVKMIVVACNTASAYALSLLRKKFDIPLIGVIDPGAKNAVEKTKNKKIGVIGTEGTINSSSYTSAIKRYLKTSKIFARACPLFVPLAEEGWFNHKVTYEVAKEYLSPLVKKGIDTLVMGCTHYPTLKNVIRNVVGKDIILIDSARSCAKEVTDVLNKNNMNASNTIKSSYKFFVSDVPEKFKIIGQRFLKKPILNVSKVTLKVF